MNDEGAPYDSGLDDSGPFADTPPPGGVSLESALREFGPAALEDLIPRVRALAMVLDEAHERGFVHGRLHPSKVIVTDDATFLVGRRQPATAALTPEVDQFALAAIAYEWMFGRPLSGPGDRPVAVRAIAGVDRGALSQAFTRALSPERSRRFASCGALVDAIAASQVPSLPFAAADAEADPVEPFIPESAELNPLEPSPALEAIDPVIAMPDYGSSARKAAVAHATVHPVPSAVAATSVTPVAASADRERFSGLALILAAIVGAVFGFAGGYMAKPRALQGPLSSASAPSEPEELRRTEPKASAPAESKPVERVERVEPKTPSVELSRIGSLLVRSNPSGATVEVDGVPRGATPLALRDLDLGSREITVSRRGYVPEQSRVVLTKARPSRSVEVRLSPLAAAAPRPSTPASVGKPAVVTGSLAVESRPTGAAVTVNGKPSGVTPLTINDLEPGEYRITMRLAGHRDYATTVRVVAGERARAAARLTEQEQE